MTIIIEELSTLDPDAIKQNLDEIIVRLQELNPTLDLRRGVLRDLMAGNHAVLSTAEQEELNRYLSARSLQQIEADPTLADEGVVDDILSNFLVTRQAGEQATGEVTLVQSSDNSVTISSGAIFEAEGKQFTSDEVFTAKAESEQINSPNDRLFTPLGDGNFSFTIFVTALEEGEESILTKDTAVVPSSPPPDFVRAFATNDFLDGRNIETNTELLLRLQEGVACNAPSNRTNMKGMLRDINDEQFVGVIHSSIVGFGDEEMLRDQHTIFPMSFGARADWYIRTQERLFRLAVRKTATLIEITTRGAVSGGCGPADPDSSDPVTVWQFALGKDEAPGFYEVRKIQLPDSVNVLGGFEIIADVRSNDLTGDGFIPDIETVPEGAYSRYQTTVIQFIDDSTPVGSLAVGATAEYDIEVAMMPDIDDIQDTMIERSPRSYGSDVLIKAPVPVFMRLSFTIFRQSNLPDPDVEAIKDALAKEVNTVPFIGRLYAAQLHDIVHGFLSDTTSLSRIDMFGRIRYPDGRRVFVRDTEMLAIDGPAEDMVSPETIQFFLDPEDVAVTISAEIPVAT